MKSETSKKTTAGKDSEKKQPFRRNSLVPHGMAQVGSIPQKLGQRVDNHLRRLGKTQLINKHLLSTACPVPQPPARGGETKTPQKGVWGGAGWKYKQLQLFRKQEVCGDGQHHSGSENTTAPPAVLHGTPGTFQKLEKEFTKGNRALDTNYVCELIVTLNYKITE